MPNTLSHPPITGKLFSIIIPNFNGEKFLKKCIGSILSSSYPNFELIVIDNNSKDSSLFILNNYANDKRVKIISLKRNIGFGPANNLGTKNSRGEFVVFLNNDTYVDENWLSELLKIFTLDETVAAIQCNLQNMISSGVYSLGGALDYSGRLIPVECLWEVSPTLKAENRLLWGCGAALSIRRAIIDKTGGFDNRLPNDEVDLCWRINLLGGKILRAPKSIVYHYGSGSFGSKLNAKRIYHSERSVITACYRNFSFSSFSSALSYLMAYLLLALAQDIFFRKRSDIVINRIKAYYHFLLDLKDISSQRRYVQNKIRKVSDVEIKKLMIKPNPLMLFRYSQITRYPTKPRLSV